ncbi:MAG TPA: aspartate/glutamate racemase family protein [Burkholderiales bacterium]|jgi:maleate isomerase|nr:aspartate/glutamate racemase family protein [Burkholderiales bacterium]
MRRPVRLGFLLPPGNPTTEPEVFRLAPPGVTVHFHRLFVAGGVPGAHEGQEERNRQQIDHMEESARLLALVKPAVIVLAHTATSYTLGKDGEAALVQRIARATGIPFITAFGAVLAALVHLGVKRVALATPYAREWTLRGKAHLEAHGIEVASWGNLEDVANIYDETPERAYALARRVDVPEAQAVFLSGVGMPTVEVLERLERDLRKPAVSSCSAMVWQALRLAGVKEKVRGFGRLLD